MIIKLVSFPYADRLSAKSRKLRINIVSDILNEKNADFVMFSEWIFDNMDDLKKVYQLTHNKRVTALFELNLASGLDGNNLFLLQNGKIKDLKTHQIFSTPKEATEENIENLIRELETHRQFVVNDKHFLILQCGENNILKTTRDKENCSEFRLSNRSDLKNRFDKVINSVDVILNPLHTKWGRFYDFSCRLYKFSERKRYGFYCCQLTDNQLINAVKNPQKNTAQRAMKSRKILAPLLTESPNNSYLLQAYEI